MTIHYQDDHVTLHHGDCINVMRTLPDASVDAVVTDPPYALGFMGREWDSFGDVGRGAQARVQRAGEVTPDGAGHSTSAGPYLASGVDSLRSAGAPFQAWCEQWAREALRVLKPGGHMLAFGGTRTWHRLACAVEDAGFEVRDNIAWFYGGGFPKSHNLTDDNGDRTGWGTALKPAFEPVVVARKPLAGTVAANMERYGTGALNIDGCRVGDGSDSQGTRPSREGSASARYTDTGATNFAATPGPRGGSPAGRWPANVILDAAAAVELDQQSGERPSGGKVTGTQQSRTGDSGIYGTYQPVENSPYNDTGGASRFFYVAKADRNERPRLPKRSLRLRDDLTPEQVDHVRARLVEAGVQVD